MATILIIDDVSAHRRFLIDLLGGNQHRLLEASNGVEALASIAKERPDLVITDVLMPVMDGYELVRRMRADAATSTIPVLFYTAPYGVQEARAVARENAVPYVLKKPAKPHEVLDVIGRVLAGDDLSEPSGTESEDHEYLDLLTDGQADADEELRLSNARIRALVNIGLQLSAEDEPDRLIDHVCEGAYDLFGASYVTLGFVDSDAGTLRQVGACGLSDDSWCAGCESAPGILGEIVANQYARRGINPGGDPTSLALPPEHPPIEAYVAAPINSPQGVYGWICLVKNNEGAFSPLDEHLVLALAGQLGRIYEIKHEIAERRSAETELRAERDRAQLYLDTADVILLALDAEGRITMINRAGCDLVGWSEEELLERDWIESIVAPSERAAIRSSLASAIDGRLGGVESTIGTRFGEHRRIEWRNLTPILDERGDRIGLFSSGADITERIEAVDALHSSEERSRFALESANIGIWEFVVAAGELRWSEILEAQYGLAPGEFGGTFEDFAARIHPDDREAVLSQIAKSMTHGGDFQLQHRIVRPDGEVRWVAGAGRTSLDPEGQPDRAIGVSMDVTERRLLEGQFQQAQKMEAIGRLAGGVAHDFNNVLTAILGYADLLLADMEPGDPKRDDVGEISKAGLSGAALTRQLLAFSRKEIVVPTLLDLNDVIVRICPMIEKLIGEDVKIHLDLEAKLSPIRADRGQIEQILMNLCVNSRDAMPRGGTLTIATRRADFDEAEAKTHSTIGRGAYAALTVADTGAGMPSDVLAHVFEPFYTTKEAGRGTGLGLSIVHGIALQSGGAVQVDSKTGEGTSITVYLPREDGTSISSEVPAPARESVRTSHTVLVVDDAESLRDLTRRLLERQGYTVLIAANADEALLLVDRHSTIDVLLTDVVMPGTSGPELARLALERHLDLRVIYMSGYTDDAIIQHGTFEHGIAFLPKPFTRETLTRKVHEVLGA